MSDPVVIASYLPGEGHFRSQAFEVVGIECRDDFDYWAGLARFWESDRPIVNLEHDVDASDEHVATLLACPKPLCSWCYRCNWISTGIPGGVIAAGTGARDRATQPDAGCVQGGEEWASWSAIGCVKIAPQARIGPLRREGWNWLELAVADAVKGPWHLHGNGRFPGDHSGLIPHHHF